MKFFIVLACLLAVACANEDPAVIRSESQVDVDGYAYALELDNGVKLEQQGKIHGEDALTVQGSSAWTSPEGEKISYSYVADENGYQPDASILPTPPPIPEQILKALEYIRTHPQPQEKK